MWLSISPKGLPYNMIPNAEDCKRLFINLLTFSNYRRFPSFTYHLSFAQGLLLLLNVISNARHSILSRNT